MKRYNHKEIENKWQKIWKKNKLYKARKKDKNNYYSLVELTYTSGDLHMGHWFAWSAPDTFVRMKRMQGNNVFFPVGGFDAFGLPAENAAIRHGINPREWTYRNIGIMRKQFEKMGPSFDWDKEVITCDSEYYRWTQWLFLQLYKKNLAYKTKVWTNWCPECKTVVANENVENGCCWRHTSIPVEQKLVEQWFFRITKYADRLIWPIDKIRNKYQKSKIKWPDAVIEGQNNWIGKSEGIIIKFPLKDKDKYVEIFTTRPDTIFGATFLVLAPEHPLVSEVTIRSEKDSVEKYIKNSLKKLERVRLEEIKDKSGVFTGSFAVNPLTKKPVPIWVADFILGSYGKGAIMGVPAHDERDWQFAKKYNLPIKEVVSGGNPKSAPYLGSGVLVNSYKYNGLHSEEAAKKISKYIISYHLGEESVQYHLRDWTISRQRYWGAPIPIVYCKNCGAVPVPEKDLPVKLPEKVDYKPTGKPPLATQKDWVNVSCPECGGRAKREVETMDTYVDSSWYFFRYLSPHYENGPFDKEIVNRWMPIKVYFGGPEHTLGHTLYARFITKFLYDLGLIKFEEFAEKRINHGVILGPDGYRMSKSRGNVVNPDEQVEKFGADTVRMYLCFLGPHSKGGSWRTEGIEGSYRFLNRVWKIFNQEDGLIVSSEYAKEIKRIQHVTIRKVTEDIDSLNTHTAIAALMEFVNLLESVKSESKKNLEATSHGCVNKNPEWEEALITLCLLLAPFAPHITEEIWHAVFAYKTSIHLAKWPKYDPKMVEEDIITIVVQVNGKLRGTLTVDSQKSRIKSEIIKLAKEDLKVSKWLAGKKIINEVFVPGKLVNFVTD